MKVYIDNAQSGGAKVLITTDDDMVVANRNIEGLPEKDNILLWESSASSEKVEKPVQINKRQEILLAPAKYHLIEIFEELKRGRPAASQKYLQKCIDEMREETREGEER